MSPGRWFPIDDECDPVHGRFRMALRRPALDWPAALDPLHSGAFVLDGVLATYVDVVGDDGVVTSLRVNYDGSLLYADETVGGLGVAGTPDACAAEGSRWFLEKLRAAR
jgi:hypothetical protein